ncbi:unnamed protein product, partial [Didymodactylos carnosus]
VLIRKANTMTTALDTSLTKVLEFLTEAKNLKQTGNELFQTGKFAGYTHASLKSALPLVDWSEYLELIEIAGKGRGYIAKKNIPIETLIMIETSSIRSEP